MFTAFMMGLAGSLHCAGMCSPLAMAVTHGSNTVLLRRIIYNAGRIMTYGVLGGVVASVGYVLPLSKYQNILSIVLGGILICLALAGTTGLRIPFFTQVIIKFSSMLRSIFKKFIQKKSAGSIFLLGALNGLLPCGLTFLAATFCLTVSGFYSGFVLMFVFGLGTLPVMLGLISIIPLLTNKLHWNVKKVTTALMAVSGVLLIMRVFLVHLPETNRYVEVVDIICR